MQGPMTVKTEQCTCIHSCIHFHLWTRTGLCSKTLAVLQGPVYTCREELAKWQQRLNGARHGSKSRWKARQWAHNCYGTDILPSEKLCPMSQDNGIAGWELGVWTPSLAAKSSIQHVHAFRCPLWAFSLYTSGIRSVKHLTCSGHMRERCASSDFNSTSTLILLQPDTEHSTQPSRYLQKDACICSRQLAKRIEMIPS